MTDDTIELAAAMPTVEFAGLPTMRLPRAREGCAWCTIELRAVRALPRPHRMGWYHPGCLDSFLASEIGEADC